MSEEKQLATCTICMEEIKENEIAKIDSCEHKFCFRCINNWATKYKNSCPNCKKKFNKIEVEENGVKKTLEVEDHEDSSSEGDHNDFECLGCHQELQDGQSHLHCVCCFFEVVHTSCFDERFKFNCQGMCGHTIINDECDF